MVSVERLSRVRLEKERADLEEERAELVRERVRLAQKTLEMEELHERCEGKRALFKSIF